MNILHMRNTWQPVCIRQRGPWQFWLWGSINAYTINQSVSYDSSKRIRNRRKHAIDLAECAAVFDAPMLTVEDDREPYDGERRFVSLGRLKDRIVVLVWTDRKNGPRMISCREAEPHEQKKYFRAYPHH